VRLQRAPTPIVVVDFTGFEPGWCDIVLVREVTPSPASTVVFVRDLLKVPPSWAVARDVAFRSPLPVSLTLVRLVARPSTAAALPPLPIEEPVPAAPVEVPPVPSVEAAVPPAAAEPAVPPVALVWARAAPDRARATEQVMIASLDMGLSLSAAQGDEVLIVQPFTVTVLADEDAPGPPDVELELELETDPPPA
jgi:hypothetical protein